MSASSTLPLRVLVVAAAEPWPLDHGGRLRLYHFLTWLARSADVTLALPHAPAHGGELPANLHVVTTAAPPAPDHPPSVAASPNRPTGWLSARLRRHFGHDPQTAAWLRRNACPPRFDVALVSGASQGQYVDDLYLPVVWDIADDDVLAYLRELPYGGPQRWPAAVRAALIAALHERYVARRCAATVLCSPVDAAYTRRWVGSARIEVVTTGVDLEYFQPAVEPPEPGTVVFVGGLDFPPNIDGIVQFATRVWPHIRGRSARRLLIVGCRPAPAVRALATITGVELVGEVPDVRPYLTRAAAVIAPTRIGGGVKNKILQACAMCRPVVASPRAVDGLSARPGVEVLCAGRRAAWVHHLTRLLEQSGYGDRIAQAGCAWVRHAHDWPVLARQLHDVLRSACR